MATILPFPAPRGGDWTASERAGLDELAARFADEAGIEVAFGRTDAGDPWCVVLDARDEVLVHVAREGRDFVAHTADDLFVRSGDLRTAVERVLGSRWHEERAEVVVPFAAAGRSAQVVTAVLVVASFVHHYRAEAEPADDWSFAAARPLKPAAPREGRDEAAKVAAAIDALPIADLHAGIALPDLQRDDGTGTPFAVGPEPLAVDMPSRDGVVADHPAPALDLVARLVEASATITGSDFADVLVGTGGDDLLDAGKAAPGTHDLLDAGAGNDMLMLEGGTVAIGGPGADIFAIRAPEAPTATSLLGVLVDFDPGTDSIVAVPGVAASPPSFTVIDSVSIADIFDDPGVNFAVPPGLPGNRLTVDLNGDGVGDGYLLVNGIIPEPATVDAVRDAFKPVADQGHDASFLPTDALAYAPVPTIEPIHAVLPDLI